MYVVIAGGGVLGGSLARRLVEARHDVVVIERDRAVCDRVASRIGALTICGTATSIETLEEAGIERAEVAVGALPVDADNLAFALLARYFEVPRIMARMRNPRYETAYKLAGVTRCINISGLFVDHLALEIEQPEVRKVATFGGGKATIVVARVPEGSPVDGKPVREVAQDKRFPEECVIAGIYRRGDEKFIFPRGAAELRAGDEVFLVADATQVSRAADFIQRRKK